MSIRYYFSIRTFGMPPPPLKSIHGGKKGGQFSPKHAKIVEQVEDPVVHVIMSTFSLSMFKIYCSFSCSFNLINFSSFVFIRIKSSSFSVTVLSHSNTRYFVFLVTTHATRFGIR